MCVCVCFLCHLEPCVSPLLWMSVLCLSVLLCCSNLPVSPSVCHTPVPVCPGGEAVTPEAYGHRSACLCLSVTFSVCTMCVVLGVFV